jgi:hypothetical protein
MAKKKKEILAPEWSHPVDAEMIMIRQTHMTIAPDADQLQRLTKRLNILSLDFLSADIALGRDSRNMIIHIEGTFHAKIQQECVITLVPIMTEIKEDFEAWYADPEQAVSLTKVRYDKQAKKGRIETPILDESEDPEPVIEGKIDLGELVTQHLSLAIDPYPHAEGAEHKYAESAENAEEMPEIRKNPFAALKNWKSRKD